VQADRRDAILKEALDRLEALRPSVLKNAIEPPTVELAPIKADYLNVPEGWSKIPLSMVQCDLREAVSRLELGGRFPVSAWRHERRDKATLMYEFGEGEGDSFPIVLDEEFIEMWNHIMQNDTGFTYEQAGVRKTCGSLGLYLFNMIASRARLSCSCAEALKRHEITAADYNRKAEESLGAYGTPEVRAAVIRLMVEQYLGSGNSVDAGAARPSDKVANMDYNGFVDFAHRNASKHDPVRTVADAIEEHTKVAKNASPDFEAPAAATAEDRSREGIERRIRSLEAERTGISKAAGKADREEDARDRAILRIDRQMASLRSSIKAPAAPAAKPASSDLAANVPNTQYAIHNTPTGSRHPLITVLDAFVAPVTGAEGTEAAKTLNERERREIFEAVSLLHHDRIEIFVHKGIGISPTMKKAIDDINMNLRSKTADKGGKQAEDIIVCHPAFESEEHLAKLLRNPAQGKRAVITADGLCDRGKLIGMSDLFKGTRVISLRLPEDYAALGPNDKTFYQAWAFNVGILARLIERDSGIYVRNALAGLLEGSLEGSVGDFINHLTRPETEWENPGIRISYFLGAMVRLSRKIAADYELLRLRMRTFWTAA
jgi:hypothetical protein